MAELHVELVSPDRQVWSGEAEMVIARTTEGEIGILPRHAPLLGELVPGPVRIRRAGDDDLVAAVHGGFLSVTEAGVSVLAESVELAEEIDVPRARAALERAGGDEDAAEAARRAVARLRAAGESA
ncbi:MAG: F0F1 ATP synthase subunit epsilon [Mycobacteriales bacterium]